jgi:hypothetical protein
MNRRAVQVKLFFARGIVTMPCETIEQLDNRSLEGGCRPYLVRDFDRSIHDVWELRHGDD